MQNLMIIESPNKVKTISRFLPSDFKIISTVGHIRDLSPYGLGFNQETLEPHWTIIKSNKYGQGKKEIVKEIKDAADKAQKIYLATDPDREGEAIAWHIYDLLNKSEQAKCERITFNEITKKAVLDAIAHPRKIDMNYVYAQFARRILDRMVGYKLSSLVQRTMKADSAGRVQSLALRFILDRENQIKNFIKTYWWTVDPIIFKELKLNLNKPNNKWDTKDYAIENGIVRFFNKETAENFKASLKKEFQVHHLEQPKQYYRTAPEPYKTSTLQQDAINNLGWTAKKITSIAQMLYEGIDVKGEHIALISYPRTDSTRYSEDFVKATKTYIAENYGKQYVSNKTFTQTTNKNNTNIQDAHEAIRVIDIKTTPQSLKNVIKEDEFKLYNLIWHHSLASLMSDALFERINIWFNNEDNLFFITHHVRLFDGWQILYKFDNLDNIDIKKFKVGDFISSDDILVSEHESLPPPRYTQATLIADLEKSGVGRPSTYSTMANIPLERGYALLEKKQYYVTSLGEEVASNLDYYFPDIINVVFTKDMEERLDKITNDEENWKTWLLEFWPKLNEKAKKVQEEIKEEKKNLEPEYVHEKCPLCNSELIYRYSKKGHSKFIGCSNYPSCKYVKSLKEPAKLLDEKCPDCGSNLVERLNKRKQTFIGCSNYPKCTYIKGRKTIKSNKTKDHSSEQEINE